MVFPMLRADPWAQDFRRGGQKGDFPATEKAGCFRVEREHGLLCWTSCGPGAANVNHRPFLTTGTRAALTGNRSRCRFRISPLAKKGKQAESEVCRPGSCALPTIFMQASRRHGDGPDGHGTQTAKQKTTISEAITNRQSRS